MSLWPMGLWPMGRDAEYRIEQPDGTRYSCGVCARCHLASGAVRLDRSIVFGPYTVIEFYPYCEICYPIMVNIMVADRELSRLTADRQTVAPKSC